MTNSHLIRSANTLTTKPVNTYILGATPNSVTHNRVTKVRNVSVKPFIQNGTGTSVTGRQRFAIGDVRGRKVHNFAGTYHMRDMESKTTNQEQPSVFDIAPTKTSEISTFKRLQKTISKPSKAQAAGDMSFQIENIQRGHSDTNLPIDQPWETPRSNSANIVKLTRLYEKRNE
ncbi:unnamed protein product [Rotaria sp. Silwood2]|nr:unnamed protein product [Rotaria sp. Silwood2]CAF4546464.1 unnamed protein product [Rotaria sp. Silwood2]